MSSRLLLAALFVLSSCSRQPSGPKAGGTGRGTGGPVPVVVALAESRDVPVEIREVGNVQPYSSVTVRSQITGVLQEMHFTEGQDVKAGDLLFSIDPRPWEAVKRQAEANLKRDDAQLVSARLEFEREKKLYESSIASRDDYDKAEATFHSAEATVLADHAAISNATLNVEYTAIRSPLDGRTGNVLIKEGNVVKAEDDKLVTINQVHPVYVAFSVPEQQLPAIRQRMKQSVLPVLAEIPGEDSPPHGELTFVDNAVDTTTGKIQLKAVFPNERNILWPGQYVRASLTLNILSNATVVPSQAVQTSQRGDFVFDVKRDSTVEKRPVVTGISRAGMMVIERGVKAGETVVTDGQLRLAEGSQVKMNTQSNGAPAIQAEANPS